MKSFGTADKFEVGRVGRRSQNGYIGWTGMQSNLINMQKIKQHTNEITASSHFGIPA